jgi:RNA polymerase sigma-70 factor (ECF subfamily)
VQELTDEIIMDRFKDGHLPELAVLFDRYHIRLYNFFLRLTMDKAISEDLTQNVFYRIIKYKHTYDSNGFTFKSWIYRLARNIYVDHCKQQKKINEQFKKLDDEHENISINHQSRNEEEFERLSLALQQLQPEHRELIMLNRFSGLKYEEISAMQGKSALSIRVQVHRAIKHLRKIYFKQQQEEKI